MEAESVNMTVNNSADAERNRDLFFRTDSFHNISSSFSIDTIYKDIMEYIELKFFHWIFIVLFAIVFFLGISGNCLVCYSVWKSDALKTVTHYFLVNLAVADFMVILICLPATVAVDTLQSWLLGLAMCKITVYLQRVSVFVSILTLMSISIERYLAICHPFRNFQTNCKTKLTLICIWVTSLTIPSIELFNMVIKHDDHVPESLRPWLSSCCPADVIFEIKFGIFLFVLMYCVPLLVMSYTYTMIAICLWSSTSKQNALSENLHYELAIEQLKGRRRSAKMLVVVVITFGICYLPIYTLNMARYTSALTEIEQNPNAILCLYFTARFLCYFNSAINPVIYKFMSGKFRKQFKTACCGCYSALRLCCCCKTQKEEDGRLHLCIPKEAYGQTTLDCHTGTGPECLFSNTTM